MAVQHERRREQSLRACDCTAHAAAPAPATVPGRAPVGAGTRETDKWRVGYVTIRFVAAHGFRCNERSLTAYAVPPAPPTPLRGILTPAHFRPPAAVLQRSLTAYAVPPRSRPKTSYSIR